MNTETALRWEQMYNDTPLRETPSHFRGLCQAPFLQHYLDTILRVCPPGSRTLETGVGTGDGAIWLSQRGVAAEGLDYAPRIVERAKQVNNILGGSASFRCGDLFSLYADSQASSPSALASPPYRVIHHQGVLEHFTVPQIQAALAQQVALAEWVIFSVPSVSYPFEPEFGDERMLPLEVWQGILSPFHIAELRYYGDPRFGGKEHLLGVLRGQQADDALLARMTVPAEPYPPGISVIVHTRNEEANLADCLASVEGCADEIIVLDMESNDATLTIARRFTSHILQHPHIQNFDRARNVSAMAASYRWLIYLDADERLPKGMGAFLRHLLLTQNPTFAALQLPFKHHFAGRWLRCLSPGYKAPSVFKNGCFTYHARTHAGAQVNGTIAQLPFDDPDNALPHYAFPDIGQYLAKLDRYTAAEAANMRTERLPSPDLSALYHAADAFVLPSRGEGWGRPLMEAMACGLPTLGTHWSGNTAFMTADNSLLIDCELVDVPEAGWREVPAYKGHRWAEPDLISLIAHLRYVAERPEEAREIGLRAQEHVTTHFSRAVVGKQITAEIVRLRTTRAVVPASQRLALSIRWEGPFLARHSLALVNRQMCGGLLAEGSVEVSLVPVDRSEMDREEEPGLAALAERSFVPLQGQAAVVHVRHQFPPRFEAPEEGNLVLIQPWEYGFLPKEWIAPILANVAEVWCYSAYVRDVYRASGIPEERLQIVPLGVDTEIFHPDTPPYVFTTEPGVQWRKRSGRRPFTLLFVGGTLHRKGIDILLDAYLRAFSAYDEVCLVIKDTGTQTVYRGQNQREQILALTQDPNRPTIVYIEEELSPHRLAGLYTACDCLVQPYRGEGFCLPALEAMACGVPVIVPEGGPTDDFVEETVGWRLRAERRPMPENQIGPWECVETPWMWEVSPDTLPWRSGEAIRQAVETAPPEVIAFVIPVQFVENGATHGATRVDQKKRAREWWFKAVEDAPHFLPSALALFDSALEVGDLATAEKMRQTVQSADPEGTEGPLLVARLAAARACA